MLGHDESLALGAQFGIHSRAPSMARVIDQMRKVAATNSSVLVRGQTGTGKELVAQAIHQLSNRRQAAFRAVNCATFTPELLASELFGHVRGAFTGAVRDRPGLFRQTHKGTLFLDEVAEMPLELQARLLRVLQTGEYIPVGGSDPKKSDVRLISATNRSLRLVVESGHFRADLMYRIRVIPIFLPPLFARAGDIEMLTDFFIKELVKAGSRRVQRVEPEAMKLLLGHSWPGNIRELRNVIEYALVMGEGDQLLAQDLTPELRGEGPPVDNCSGSSEQLERDRILQALNQCRGKKGKAAEKLEMSRSTLWRKMREHGL